MSNRKKKPVVPPSLQPRKTSKKAIPGAENKPTEKPPAIRKPKSKPAKKTLPKTVIETKEIKERFTLWLSEDVYKAFKIHTATRKGSASDYIEMLIRKDLKLKP